MPLQRCKLPNGKSGFKYGSNGKCYASKKDAIKQGVAIDGPDKVREELAKSGQLNDPEVRAAIGAKPTNAESTSDKYASALASHLAEEQAVADDHFSVAYVSVEERNKMSPEDFGDPKNKRYPVKDQKHLDLAWRLSGREAPAKQKSIRQRLVEIAKRKNLKLPSTAK